MWLPNIDVNLEQEEATTHCRIQVAYYDFHIGLDKLGECLQRLIKQETADANYILLLEPVANNIYTHHLKITNSRHIRIRTALQGNLNVYLPIESIIHFLIFFSEYK